MMSTMLCLLLGLAGCASDPCLAPAGDEQYVEQGADGPVTATVQHTPTWSLSTCRPGYFASSVGPRPFYAYVPFVSRFSSRPRTVAPHVHTVPPVGAARGHSHSPGRSRGRR